LEGHSDADVLTHAACDALLGAAALGDIGTHFPDTDPRFAGASSLELLARVVALVRGRGLVLSNLDGIVLAQRPKIALHIPAIRERLAAVLSVEPDRVSVKAKTGEGLDAVGRGEGIAAHVVALLVNTSGARDERSETPAILSGNKSDTAV
ncbi:MAG TPA: 2-C-methyl-D-erythritol 2,4-cyclodiphosphate synthase, partial [Blastocatellia bacterium]|nr:2-C-methyl-D-erythritol 2,4-cyclodiphosphate synthase [Blastocatellia bacterium]